jgi:hypothetical protein
LKFRVYEDFKIEKVIEGPRKGDSRTGGRRLILIPLSPSSHLPPTSPLKTPKVTYNAVLSIEGVGQPEDDESLPSESYAKRGCVMTTTNVDRGMARVVHHRGVKCCASHHSSAIPPPRPRRLHWLTLAVGAKKQGASHSFHGTGGGLRKERIVGRCEWIASSRSILNGV